MKALLILSLVALSCAAACQKDAAGEREDLREAARELCAELRRERLSGLPSPERMSRLQPMLTPELAFVIEAARARQQEQMRRHPGEKPQWVEGDLFSSLFEGVKHWEIGEVTVAPGADGEVKVKNRYEEPGLDAVEWADTWIFKRAGARWLLDDIRMGGDWAFRSGESLRHALPGGGKEEADHVSPDEQWRVTFTRDAEEVTRVAIQPAGEEAEPFLLFGGDGDDSCPMPTWVVWSPACDLLALRLGDGPRFTSTRVFRLGAQGWEPLVLPEFYAEERRSLDDRGFEERGRLVDAEYWSDANTLVSRYFGLFVKGDEGAGFHKLVSVRFDESGTGKVTGAVGAPDLE